eukprot:gnl/TRDRNA2_/TRDRNA2_164636_c0_seq1.p1 gnl/TRDRNA2_/TRDRNA2_164636_c0~~gnl/TRDRNA2_/TRDRNA2_164636_c0_seq1.p1  ORF type:complete len:384 (-),score=78.82 gnl/TRDRNA2_/TRDRNA2_164636_c0_seq1:125-1276(-)
MLLVALSLAFLRVHGLRLEGRSKQDPEIEELVKGFTDSVHDLDAPNSADMITGMVRQFTKAVKNLNERRNEMYHQSERRLSNANCSADKLAVCITGQLSRLETRSKMENFLAEEAKKRGDGNVDVFLVLETNADFFVNKKTIAGRWTFCHEDFRNVSAVEDVLAPFYKSGYYHTHTDWKTNLRNWKSYGMDKPNLPKHMRLESHISQWKHWSQCSELIKQWENKTKCEYETVVRMRDNGVVTTPMTLPEHNKVLVKDCAGWEGGWNDKFSAAPRSLMENAFEGPYELAAKVNKGEKMAVDYIADVSNPELFMRRAYEALGMDAQLDKGHHISVVDGRCWDVKRDDAKFRNERVLREFCLVPKEKDCRPHDFKGEYKTCPDMEQ